MKRRSNDGGGFGPMHCRGIPLAKVGFAVVDADWRGSGDGVAQVTNIGCLGPHSKITTPSGGLHLVFAQPDPPIKGRFEWCDGVEVLGEGRLLTCYDLEELKFPRVAPRAVLPKMFWKPRDEVGTKRNPIKKDRPAPRTDAVYVADVTAALREMDPCDWRGDYVRWFALMTACCAEGISERDFVAWSIGDPQYAADGNQIRKMWRKLKPQHGGALFAALAERGIKVGNKGSLINGVPVVPKPPAPTINLQHRTTYLMNYLAQAPTEQRLFNVACVFGEIIVEGKIKVGIATKLLQGACWANGLTRLLGKDRVQETIANGFRRIEEKVLNGT
jgi:hypothetical protein